MVCMYNSMISIQRLLQAMTHGTVTRPGGRSADVRGHLTKRDENRRFLLPSPGYKINILIKANSWRALLHMKK